MTARASLIIFLISMVVAGCSGSSSRQPSAAQLRSAAVDSFIDYWKKLEDPADPDREYITFEIVNSYEKTYGGDEYYVYELTSALSVRSSRTDIPGFGQLKGMIGLLKRGDKWYWRWMTVDGPDKNVREVREISLKN